MQGFYEEIFQQPQALDDLFAHYEALDLSALQARFRQKGVLLVGMGASYHAAQLAAYRQQQVEPTIRAAEGLDLLNYNPGLLRECQTLVYISQSGASGEVVPLFERLPASVSTIGITNSVDSPLGQRAGTVLPLCAGDEYTVATKTYLNTLALLNLLCGVELAALRQLRERVAALLHSAEATRSLWIETLADARTLYFLGHGPHAITARHCAMMAGEWAKRPVFHSSIGAFRHGYIEAVEPGVGVVIFAPPGVGQASALQLADELSRYGASVLVVENGHTRRVSDPPQNDSVDEYLSPLLDVIPGQLFAEALARHAHIPPGFRYISKVVTKL